VNARHAAGVVAVPLARVMALVLVGLGSVGTGWLLWPPADGVMRAASATVVQSVLCGGSPETLNPKTLNPEAPDLEARVEVGGDRELTARLDGCGHRLGEVLTVELPDPLPKGEPVARLAGTGVPTAMAAARRLGAVGVAVAGIAGALLAWRLRGDQDAARRSARVGP